MAEINALTMNKIRSFIECLKDAGYEISEAYLFGSCLAGRMDSWSDIDIAVVSPQLGKDRLEERIRLMELALPIDDRIEPLPLNPSDLNDIDPLIKQIRETGLSLIQSN
jgi:predicted nucleotidyltransferase